MKFDKSKAIIAVMAVVLVGTTTVALANVIRIQNEEKGASEKMVKVSQVEKESTTENNVITNATESTTKTITTTKATTKNVTTSSPENKIYTENTTGTPGVIYRDYVFDKELSCADLTINFKSGHMCILEDGTGTLFFDVRVIANVPQVNIDRARMIITDENGKTFTYNEPGCRIFKYAYVNVANPLAIYITKDTKQVNITYTFDDGTVASTTLNLA